MFGRLPCGAWISRPETSPADFHACITFRFRYLEICCVAQRLATVKMFGVIEGFAIAGSVAAIISAFKDGRSLFRNWRAQKKAKRLQGECDEVQESLRKSPATIEKTYEDFHRRLGNAFGKGDGKNSFASGQSS